MFYLELLQQSSRPGKCNRSIHSIIRKMLRKYHIICMFKQKDSDFIEICFLQSSKALFSNFYMHKKLIKYVGSYAFSDSGNFNLIQRKCSNFKTIIWTIRWLLMHTYLFLYFKDLWFYMKINLCSNIKF